MDMQLKKHCEKLRSMNSQDAATWLMEIYPIENLEYGNAIMIMTHRSWKKADQIRLAEYYLKKLPFATARPYEAFLTFMSIQTFLDVISNFLPKESAKIDLLLYYLRPILIEKLKSPLDLAIINQFLDGLTHQHVAFCNCTTKQKSRSGD